MKYDKKEFSENLQGFYDELMKQRQIVECRQPMDIYEMNERLGKLLIALTIYMEVTHPEIKKNEKIW